MRSQKRTPSILSGPLLYSYVVQNLTWQWGFWFVTIPLGIAVLLVFFFVPEVGSICTRLIALLLTTHRLHITVSLPSLMMPNATMKKNKASTTFPLSLLQRDRPIRTALRRQVTFRSSRYGMGFTAMWTSWRSSWGHSRSSSHQSYVASSGGIYVPVTDDIGQTGYIFMVHGLQTVWLSASSFSNLRYKPWTHHRPGLLPICSSTIFTLEYNFTASQIVELPWSFQSAGHS